MNRRPATVPRPQAGGTVRVIGGRWRGTRLPVPDMPGLRPTSDRVRETLFKLFDVYQERQAVQSRR